MEIFVNNVTLIARAAIRLAVVLSALIFLIWLGDCVNVGKIMSWLRIVMVGFLDVFVKRDFMKVQNIVKVAILIVLAVIKMFIV